MKRKISKLTLLPLFLVPFLAFSQDYSFQLKEVYFGEDPSGAANNITILRDEMGDVAYTAPQYQVGRLEQYPIAYESGKKVYAKATFFTDCDQSVYIRGIGPPLTSSTSMQFPVQEVSPTNAELVYDYRLSLQNFVAQEIGIKFFFIKWQISLDGTSNWVNVGTSTNVAYVTRSAPLEGTKAYHSLLQISCAAGEVGNTSDSDLDVVEDIWTAFEKTGSYTFPGIRRLRDNRMLTYYNAEVYDPNECALSFDQLLYNPSADGGCWSFAFLLDNAIAVQGIENSQVTALFTPPLINTDFLAFMSDYEDFFGSSYNEFDAPLLSNNNHMLVKNWQGLTPGQFILLHEEAIADEYNAYVAFSADGDQGVAGQGEVVDPNSIFFNHAVVYYGSKIYDPSYGIAHSSQNLSNYEDSSLHGTKSIVFRRNTPLGSSTWNYYLYIVSPNVIGVEELIAQ